MKNADWAAQEEIRKTAQAWVEKANAANVERMQHEFTNQLGPLEEDIRSLDPIWQALADYHKKTPTVSSMVPLGRRGMYNGQTGHESLRQFYGDQQ